MHKRESDREKAHLDVVEWDELHRITALSLEQCDALLGRRKRAYDDGVHLTAHQHGNGNVVATAFGLDDVDEAAKHLVRELALHLFKRLCHALLLLAAAVLGAANGMQVRAGTGNGIQSEGRES
jgi:predicted small secreted protein